jgi:hypothetical protein
MENREWTSTLHTCCTALRFKGTSSLPAARRNFDTESACLMTNNGQNLVVTIHRSQEAFKMLSLYMWTFLALAEDIPNYPSKLYCRNICNFLTNILFQSTPEEKGTRIKIK